MKMIAALLLFSIQPAFATDGLRQSPDFRLYERIMPHPADYAHPDGDQVDQLVRILVPQDATPDTPVFFFYGNESPISADALIRLRKLHKPVRTLVYVQAEHRGYGQSLSRAEDQSIPRYVTTENAIRDAHEVIASLRREFRGPWISAGWSYSGSLAIIHAARYPGDFDVVVASSAVRGCQFSVPSYDLRTREALGEPLYGRLRGHIGKYRRDPGNEDHLLRADFIETLATGIAQYEGYFTYRSLLSKLAALPTSVFYGSLRALDRLVAGGEAWNSAAGAVKAHFSRPEALKNPSLFGGRTWFYQTCSELGSTAVAADAGTGSIFGTEAQLAAACLKAFGTAAAQEHPWCVADDVANVQAPVIRVVGGRDPWADYGFQPGDPFARGKYLYYPDGFHGPDRDHDEIALEVLRSALGELEGVN
jgi:pimeloyl-ACP methyl ester carboxylesterase